MKSIGIALLFILIPDALAAQTYFEFTDVIALSPTSLLVASGEHAFEGATLITRTTDNGATWRTTPCPAHLQNITFPDSMTGFATKYPMIDDSSDYELYKTTDGGVTWNVILSFPKIPHAIFSTPSICFPSRYTGIFAAGADTGVVLYTTDGGSTWHPSAVDSASLYTLIIYGCTFTDTSTGFSMDMSANMYNTTDGGASWSYYQRNPSYPNSALLTALGPTTLAFAAIHFNHYRTCSLFITHDLGNTWNEVYKFTTETDQTIIAIGHFDNTHYFGWSYSVSLARYDSTYYMPIRSTDGGRSWSVINDPITIYKGHSFLGNGVGYVIDFHALYKTTDYGATWNVMYDLTDVENASMKYEKSYVLFQNYPNPADKRQKLTFIPFSLISHAHIRLVVYDIMGREVRTVLDADRAPGEYTERLDVAGLAPGVYLIALMAGGQAPMVRRMEVR